mmetsp:Transcript_63926/g.101752  ORF Transcript_63926/g.101752 Transcript_63926/m.101752 type:complete len:157 (-) Transcript_63926:12-482(-)
MKAVLCVVTTLLVSNCLAVEKYRTDVCTLSDTCQTKQGSTAGLCKCMCGAEDSLIELSKKKCRTKTSHCTSVAEAGKTQGAHCKTGQGDNTPAGGLEYQDMFGAKEEYDELLADYEYDAAVQEAREERDLKRLKAEKQHVLRAKARVHRLQRNQFN